MQQEKVYTVSVLRGNLAALLLSIPIISLSVFVFLLFWPLDELVAAFDLLLIWVVPIIISGVILHEFLHGIIWSLFAKSGWKSIQFGFKWSSLTPYSHCKEPIRKFHYVLGTIMPFLVLGLLPIIGAIFIGEGVLLLTGILFSIGAGSDLYGLWMLRKANSNSFIQDHPEEIGYIIVDQS